MEQRTVDIRTLSHSGVILPRQRAHAVHGPAAAVSASADQPPASLPDAHARRPGASMWVMEAGIAVVAIGTAVLIGLGR
jgi:hypothetical protein